TLFWFDYDSFGGPRFLLQSKSTNLGNGTFVDPKAITIHYLVPEPEAPVITSTPAVTATTHEDYSYQPAASGSQPLTWSLDAGTPAGVTVNPNTGLVEWTPDTAGSYTIHLRVTNAVGTDLQSYPLEVSDPPAPVITSLPATQGAVNQPYAYQAGAVGVEPISWAVEGPAGMTIGAANGLVQWTPATTGTFPVTVTATN